MRTNLARKKSAKASRKSASAYKFFYMLYKTMVFWPIFRKKRGENPLSMGILLFARTKIIHFPSKSKSL